MSVNNKYKDSVFTLLFNNKKYIVELFNALEGTEYRENELDIQINTLEDVLFMDRKNDLSFIVNGRFIILIEHQSSINQNMPLRFLSYIARVLEKIVDRKAIYKEALIKIPSPEFIVFYNGYKDFPKETILNLSDAFITNNESPNLELTVKVININYNKSGEILKKSKALNEYSYFTHKVKEYKDKGLNLEDAIKNAVSECIKEDILRDFLKENGTEVVNMLYTEFNLEDAKEVWIEEAKEEAREEAREEAIKEKLESAKAALELGLTLEQASKITGLSIDEIKKHQ